MIPFMSGLFFFFKKAFCLHLHLLSLSQEADEGYNPLADNEVLEDVDEGIFFCVID